MIKKLTTCLMFVILCNCALAEERRSVTGPVLLGTGVALVSAGLIGNMSAASWSPMIREQEQYINDLREDGYDTGYATAFLTELNSARSNIKTVAMVSLGAGILSVVIGIIKIETDRHVRLVPVIQKDGAELKLSMRF